jgi:hypothetical protein
MNIIFSKIYVRILNMHFNYSFDFSFDDETEFIHIDIFDLLNLIDNL